MFGVLPVNLTLRHFSANKKKGLRAVIPGFTNYKYRDGETAGHTKSAFSDYKILTIHGIITLNSYIFIRKARHFSSLLPPSIISTISKDSPLPDSTHETCDNWLKFYDNHYYRKSLFFKGPLLVLSPSLDENLSPVSYINMKSYKINVKGSILKIQGSGTATEWQVNNFPLYAIQGRRKSSTKCRTALNYSEHSDDLNFGYRLQLVQLIILFLNY